MLGAPIETLVEADPVTDDLFDDASEDEQNIQDDIINPFDKGGRRSFVTDMKVNVFDVLNVSSDRNITNEAHDKYIVPISKQLIKYPFLKLTIIPMFHDASSLGQKPNDNIQLAPRANALMQSLIKLGVDPSQLGKYWGEFVPKEKMQEANRRGIYWNPVKFLFEKK